MNSCDDPFILLSGGALAMAVHGIGMSLSCIALVGRLDGIIGVNFLIDEIN